MLATKKATATIAAPAAVRKFWLISSQQLSSSSSSSSSSSLLLSSIGLGCCRSFSAAATTAAVNADVVAAKCHRNVVSSPYPDIPEAPYPPLAEFVMSEWNKNKVVDPNGTLSSYRWNKICIVDTHTGMERTFADQAQTIGGLAAFLKYDMNIGQGQCVALFCPNHVDYLAIPLAVSLTGAMLTPINPLYTAQELTIVLEKSRSRVLIVHVSKLNVALQAIQQQQRQQQINRNDNHPIKQVIVITDDVNDDHVDKNNNNLLQGIVALKDLRNHDKAFLETVHPVQDQTKDHPCILPYSSGTTGLPKGVCLTHENIIANLHQIHGIEGNVFQPTHKLSSPLPFFHIYAFTISMLYTAWQGQTLITSSGRFDLEEYCKAVEKYRVERAHLVPPILLGLAKSPVVDNYDLSSLQCIISAAAPLSKDIEEKISKRLGCIVKQYWGMSELSPLATGNTDHKARSGSVGPLTGSTFAKIVDASGNTLGPNQSGELLIKGPQVMKEYLNEPDKTLETVSQCKWLRTGDIAHYDEDGYFYITDRIKELIKVRGFQVAPAELEALLLTHDTIGDCAVIGVEDEAAGELPKAFIVLKNEPVDLDEASEEETRKEIYAWVKERVAPYKRLDGGIVFTDHIPKSASGKILRRILRDGEAAKAATATKK